ncbi:tetratricopeptide repeat protein 34 [Protopterus annectens]|uniref:tetratricopeptide repeat protein 34 n=1 Tax=Protopterus annectens TaxID=7888 RepID=UPI001CFB8357|nr:tetratricopeptide repeat protein 34 [Protopterus annectens]
MSASEATVALCQEGTHCLTSGDLALATAYYTAAFSCNATATVEHIRSLGRSQEERLIATLEKWCVGQSRIPKIPVDKMVSGAPNSGIAAVFLSTLSPNNLASSFFKMNTLIKAERFEDVISRCNLLLNIHPKHSVELLLTRGLAWVLSETHSRNGVVDYIQAFVKQASETVEFVCTRQKEYTSQVTQAFRNYIALHENSSESGPSDSMLNECYRFLTAVSPQDIRMYKMQAAYLFEKCRFDECVAVYAKAIAISSDSTKNKPDLTACLLVDRAAAYFSIGSRTKDMIQDLTEAFERSPVEAKRHFEELFMPQNAGLIVDQVRGQIEADFSTYREAVRNRSDLRSSSDSEMLSTIVHALQFLIYISQNVFKRELSIRLADCKLLSGDFKSALEICSHLLASDQKTYQNTLLAIRGFCYLHAGDNQNALMDFQKIFEHESPHPNSCVKALCGRGLVRMLRGSSYLTAVDYVTASRLKLDETVLTTKSYVPWNHRGLLLKVLQEEGQKMLQKKTTNQAPSPCQKRKNPVELNGLSFKEGDVSGVYHLASLLLELDQSDDVSRILCADALYQMGRVEEAHKMLLVSLSGNSQKSPVLARLALLQLKKGFLYDGNQLIKKVIHIGDTTCLLPIMDVFTQEDRGLMQDHCHSSAMTILKTKQGDTYVKEAIAYLSLAIIASGGRAENSLLSRARCYGHLGQKKTAIFDFSAILKENPSNVEALCGRSFMYLVLNQQKEAVQDIISALTLDPDLVTRELLALKQEAQTVITQWLYEHSRKIVVANCNGSQELSQKDALRELSLIGHCLLQINENHLKWHTLYSDILVASGKCDQALVHLQKFFGCDPEDATVKARCGLIHMTANNLQKAVDSLHFLAEADPKELEFVLCFLNTKQRQLLAQFASQEGTAWGKKSQQEKALPYHSLAVLSSNKSPQHLRQHAKCLAHLKQYTRSLADMDEVITRHTNEDVKSQVGDYCMRGYILLLISKDEDAIEDYMKALHLNQALALSCIASKPGRQSLAQTFHKTALHHCEQQLHEKAWKITECGFVIDHYNSDLKKLKNRLKREASGCLLH